MIIPIGIDVSKTVGLGTNSGTVSVTARSLLSCRITVPLKLAPADISACDASNGVGICAVWIAFRISPKLAKPTTRI